ncbi:uncharacterized protein LOC127249665 isoform X2 [Andrographis paniculata]|uniref:uncharacterized protein LOC127249665 isoform X2 n=1 Tax=Andrographis paniculata TaxID=175694 RepID=UPI0021E887E3|nr:uncharacterized protein LOC127249665 isoform X2 [Andrographis paniculata]
MPKELPGFYYDAEKNRYFPLKGPIPGSSPKPPPMPPSSRTKQVDVCQSTKVRQEELLQARELFGKVISSRKGKVSMQAEYQKRHASKPTVWKYKGTKRMGNIALEHMIADVTSPHGLIKRDILFTGGANGLLCLFQVGMAQQDIDPTQAYKADCIWPLNLDQAPTRKELLRHLGSSYGATTYMSSDVSSIKASMSSSPASDMLPKHFLITTLGSGSAPGSVYLLDLTKPLDFDASVPMAREGFYELASFRQTLWTADCGPGGRHAAIGTNRGVELLNMDTGASSRVLHCEIDVLSLQIDQSGNFIISGLRNGAIMTVDSRQKPIKRSRNFQSKSMMPSSVCCLTSLKAWDQYFLASSMDGSIWLYDQRSLERGPVQSYEGNVNSHTRIQLGVDPSEKVVLSGGEDCCVRLWDIKSGELLFKDRMMNSIPSAVCWPRNSDGQDCNRWYWEEHHLGAWLGSYDGITYMDWL